MSFDSTVHAKAVELAKLSYEMTAAAGSGHPTTAASLAHLTTVLMYQHMRYEPANPAHAASDRLVLSEGHAVPIIYAACADLGVAFGQPGELRPMTREDAMTLRAMDSAIDGHPNPIEGFPFFDTATGSLGQGLSHAAGLASAAKVDGLDKRVFCIIGDGEAREGQIWEAADYIIDHGLSAVCPIFNCNAYAQSDKVSAQQSAETIAKKLEAYGFEPLVIDGHNPTQISEALSTHAQAQHDPNRAPIAIVAKTVKGWGSASQQGDGHHGKPASGDDLKTALEELDATGRQIGAAEDTNLKIAMMSPGKPEPPEVHQPVGLTKAASEFGVTLDADKGLASRRAYGIALRALGHADPRVVALDADVKNSTFAEDFAYDEALTGRYFECRIAEQNMFSVAAGLSAAGKVPFCSTFAKFVNRGYDQIEMAVNSGANFKIVGSHSGITLAADGPSQMSLPDVAWFRAFTTANNQRGNPCFYVLNPSDAYQCYALTVSMAQYYGPVYMRTMRPATEFLYGDNDRFEVGGDGFEVLTPGRDLLIVATGYMVHEANRALEALDAEGIDATIVDLYQLPFNEEKMLDLANDNNGMVLTLEDNYGGGFGSAIADVVSATGDGFNVKQLHVRRIPKSGRTPDELLAYCGLSAQDIVKQAMSLLELTAA